LLARTNKLNYFVNMGKYRLRGKLVAAPGKRQELIAIMARAVDRVGELAGCLLYIVSGRSLLKPGRCLGQEQ